MNYLKEIIAFENWLEYNSTINKSDIRLWYTLLHTANRFNWEEFTMPISTLIFKSKLSKSDIYRARNKLKQLGLIDFKERSGSQCAIYKMKSCISLFGTQIGTQIETQSGTPFETPSGALFTTPFDPNPGNINKLQTQLQSQTKDIPLTTFEGYSAREENAISDYISETANNKRSGCAKRAKKAKQSYGEFGNVQLSAEELGKLKTKLGGEAEAYIERLSGYMASTGKRYKDHYATILNWFRKDTAVENAANKLKKGDYSGEYGAVGTWPNDVL